MELVMICETEGSKQLFRRKLNGEERRRRLLAVIDLVRSLPGWEISVSLGFERECPRLDSPFRAHFKQDISDIKEGDKIKRMVVYTSTHEE